MEVGKGGSMGMKRDLTLSGKCMMQYADVLLSCILETSVVLLTTVTPINSIKKKKSWCHSQVICPHLAVFRDTYVKRYGS